MKKRLFTSESVTEGHPDKVCDRISDSVLDQLLSDDRDSRVACETIATMGMVFVTGEITTKAYADIASIARKAIAETGYDRPEYGFDANTCAVLTSICEQSPDIALGVDRSLEAKNGELDDKYEIGAGDQGMVFGYACSETPEKMPYPIITAHKLAKRLAAVRKDGTLPYLRPDGKTQVTVEYDGDRPVHCDSIVISAQHSPDVTLEKIRSDIYETVIREVIEPSMIDGRTEIYVNPTGRFVMGGPAADSGLTGRKIIVDTYGGYSRHGGGAFSGKDPTKVDRSASYAARYVAKNIVAAGLADRCELQVAYAIGVAKPLSVFVETFGTGKADDMEIAERATRAFDFRPAAIIDCFGLKDIKYAPFSAYGHMGREDLNAPWERTDLADKLK